MTVHHVGCTTHPREEFLCKQEELHINEVVTYTSEVLNLLVMQAQIRSKRDSMCGYIVKPVDTVESI